MMRRAIGSRLFRDRNRTINAPDTQSASKSDERAMEEWRQLQAIIGRYDGFDFSIRGWLLVLVGAAMTAHFSKGSPISTGLFVLLALTAIIALLMSELSIRVVKRRAINRVFVIEEALRKEADYDGPRISLTLSSQYTADKESIDFGERVSGKLERWGWKESRATRVRKVVVSTLLWFGLMFPELLYPPVLLFYVPLIAVVIAASFPGAA
ncbi:hypothetical protein [Caballeronia humi]|uniref:Uncharacterized protein n=1 Tax=Caballeronia humi TaxID=326474 RepID=A0A158GM77_9BURK|nr:hypothetical protein [Caballeronia humi]SAL32911.1 hypothetical protein AWB65_02187 [Caballeronia humi]